MEQCCQFCHLCPPEPLSGCVPSQELDKTRKRYKETCDRISDSENFDFEEERYDDNSDGGRVKGRRKTTRGQNKNKRIKSETRDISKESFRSSLNFVIDLIEEMARKQVLKQEHIEEIRKTPFGRLFEAIRVGKIEKKDVGKNTNSIYSILQNFDVKEPGIEIEGKMVKFKAEDISLIFGLPMQGKCIDPSQKNQAADKSSAFVQKYFPNKENVFNKNVKEAILKSMTVNDEVGRYDFARLMSLYILGTVFFANAAGRISWSIIANIENTEKIKAVSWPVTVHKHLVTQIGINKGKRAIFGGCILSLLFWVCEHVKVMDPQEDVDSCYPRLCKWTLVKLLESLNKQPLHKWKGMEVLDEITDLSDEEKKLLNMDPNIQDQLPPVQLTLEDLGTLRTTSGEATSRRRLPIENVDTSSAVTVAEQAVASFEEPMNNVSKEKLDPSVFLKATVETRDTAEGVAVSTKTKVGEGACLDNVPLEFIVLYKKIDARYGRLDKYLPGYLPQTYDALRKELLETISVMMHTKPSELSISLVSQWERIVNFAAYANFNVGWLSSILVKMREFVSGDGVTSEMVMRQAGVVEDLKKKVSSARERLNMARHVVGDLEKEVSDTSSCLEVACSVLETLENHQLYPHFFSDLN